MKKQITNFNISGLLLLFAMVFCIYGCSKNSEKDSTKNIYQDGREWTFNVAFKDAAGMVTDTCSLKLQVGEVSIVSLLAEQKGITFEHYNCAGSESYKETTGVLENEEQVFLHSPRTGAFAFTEVVPFPTIAYPLESKTSSEIELDIVKSDDFKIAENKTIKQILERNTTDTIIYKGAKLACYLVEGKNTNYIEEIGQYTGTYWFNEKYGFVKLLYKKPDGSTVDLVLAETNF